MPQSYYKKPTFAIPRTIFRESNQEPERLSLGQGYGKSMENVRFCHPPKIDRRLSISIQVQCVHMPKFIRTDVWNAQYIYAGINIETDFGLHISEKSSNFALEL